jgi:hypothetical protein
MHPGTILENIGFAMHVLRYWKGATHNVVHSIIDDIAIQSVNFTIQPE